MKKIIDYKIVVGNVISGELNLVNRVLEAIQEGWQPLGGVAVDADGMVLTGREYQVMVKYEEE